MVFLHSLSPGDVYVRAVAYPSPHSPKTLNGDAAGTVAILGVACSAKFAVGDAVYILASDYVASTGENGTYAAFVNVKEELVHKMMERVPWC